MRKIIIGLAPLLLATGGAAIAAPGAWSVSEVSGNVRLSENGKSRAAVRGALLSSGASPTMIFRMSDTPNVASPARG